MEYSVKKPLLTYFLIQILTICAFWCNSNSFYFSIIIIPVLTLGVAIAIGFRGCGFTKGVMIAFGIGISYMFSDYFTLSLSNMLFNRYASFNLPSPEYILFGGVIFFLGFLVGLIGRAFKRH